MFDKDEHEANADFPSTHKDNGKIILSNFLHPSNALSFISVNFAFSTKVIVINS